VTAFDFNNYVIDNQINPTLNLQAGSIYVFNVSAGGNPFWIKTVNINGTDDGVPGVWNNGVDAGVIVFFVPTSGQTQYFYNCEFHPAMNGILNIVTASSSTASSSTASSSSSHSATASSSTATASASSSSTSSSTGKPSSPATAPEPYLTLLISLSAVCCYLSKLLSN